MSALKGNAGFKYTDPGTSQTVTVALPVPLQRVSVGEAGPRWERWSLDLTTRDVVTLGTPASDLWATVRCFGDATALLKMLRHGLEGVTLTYYPSLSETTENYPCHLVAVEGADGETVALEPDPDRYGFGEWSVRLHLRGVNGATFLGLFT